MKHEDGNGTEKKRINSWHVVRQCEGLPAPSITNLNMKHSVV